MKKLTLLAIACLVLAGCSLATLGHFLGNVSAGDCDSVAAQQAFVGDLPQIAFMTNTQALKLMSDYCTGAYGTAPAPTPAPGQSGIFATATPAAVPTPAAKAW